MSRPQTPYEAASYDLNQFRERRMVERRATQRDSADRRIAPGDGKAEDQSTAPLAVPPEAAE